MTTRSGRKIDMHDIEEVRAFLNKMALLRISNGSEGFTELSTYYELSAQIWEDYSVRAHTARVLLQDKRYFESSPLPDAFPLESFRLFLALHDIGKGLGREAQHEHTESIIRGLITSGSIVVTDAEFSIVLQLLHDSPISLFSSLFKHCYRTRPSVESRYRLKAMCEQRGFTPLPRRELVKFAGEMTINEENHAITVRRLAEEYHRRAKELSLTPRELYRLHLRYFQVDTSAYSNESLDDLGRIGYQGFEYLYKLQEEAEDDDPLFIFDQGRDRLSFAAPLEPLVQQLEEELKV